ncbi:hypothetical protein [Nocardia sp. NPDC004711]
MPACRRPAASDDECAGGVSGGGQAGEHVECPSVHRDFARLGDRQLGRDGLDGGHAVVEHDEIGCLLRNLSDGWDDSDGDPRQSPTSRNAWNVSSSSIAATGGFVSCWPSTSYRAINLGRSPRMSESGALVLDDDVWDSFSRERSTLSLLFGSSRGLVVPVHESRARIGAWGLALAGVLFLVYEIVAPRTAEDTLEGAAAWASPGWSIGHVAAIVGLVLIPLGWDALRNSLADNTTERLAYLATTLGFIGSALSISYYGAEVYGLRAIGARAVADGDASLMTIGQDFRMSPIALTIFALGLILIAAAAILAAVAIWRSGTLRRWSGVPLATAMVLYFPHFLLPHTARIGWGALVAVGAVWIAVELQLSTSHTPGIPANQTCARTTAVVHHLG